MPARTSALLIAASFVYREQLVFNTLLPLFKPGLARHLLASGFLIEERLLLFPTPKDAALFSFRVEDEAGYGPCVIGSFSVTNRARKILFEIGSSATRSTLTV